MGNRFEPSKWSGTAWKIVFILCVLACSLSPAASTQEELERAPFRAVRWIPEVNIEGRWYELRSIDGMPVQEIVEFILRQEGDPWAQRFAEDLAEMLTDMGHPPGASVKVVVRDRETGEEKTFEKVPLTAANREAIQQLRRELESRPLPNLEPAAVASALDSLKTALDERWSYRHANGADYDAAIAALRERIGAGMSRDELGVELQKIIALGIDGHSGVSGYRLPQGGFLPFLIEPAGERFVAFNPERRSFLADGFPFLTRIDGKPIAEWCAAAAGLVPKGSPQYIRQRQAIAEFARSFKPRWELPKGRFSDWHYMVLRRLDDPDVYHYDKPVIVLMNAKCFSATDIFLAGLKGMKNVLLLGTPSSGGSAFTQDVVLGATPLRLRIGSIASFQADGRLFDGNGIRLDVLVEPIPDYYIGGRDNALEEAVRRIRDR